jgi:hypothetical protein
MRHSDLRFAAEKIQLLLRNFAAVAFGSGRFFGLFALPPLINRSGYE